MTISGWHFKPTDAIFVSISIDMANALFVTYAYVLTNKVELKYAILASIPACLITYGFTYLMPSFLQWQFINTLLAQGGGYLALLFAAVFLIKGVREWVQEWKKDKVRAVYEGMDQPESFDDITADLPEPKRSIPCNIYAHSMCIMAIAAAAAASGLIGVGSGTLLIICFCAFLGWELVTATGTSHVLVFSMSATVVCMFEFGSSKGRVSPLETLYPYILIPSLISGVSALLAAIFSSKVSRTVLSFVVATVLFILGIFGIVQVYILKEFPLNIYD